MTRRADGRWQEAVVINGKRKYFYGKSKAEVLRKIRDAEEETKAGKLFPAVADEWWAKHEPTLSPTTIKGYLPAMRRAQEYFAGQDMATIRPVDFSRFLAKMVDENDMAEKTAKTQLLVINLICRYAVAEGIIDTNPCAELRVQRGLEKTAREMPSHEDLAKVKENIDLPWGFFPYLILCSGLRKGEALGLRWGDINLKDRTIHVQRSVYYLGNAPQLKAPKTKAGTRKVPIIDALIPYLQPGPADTYVIGGGTSPVIQSQFEDGFALYRKTVGLECTAHQLRHAYVTMLWEAGVEPEIAMKFTGHAQISTMRDIYTHIREEKQAEARNRFHSIALPE